MNRLLLKLAVTVMVVACSTQPRQPRRRVLLLKKLRASGSRKGQGSNRLTTTRQLSGGQVTILGLA